MLVKELKDTIKKYSKEDKDKIIVELYKRIPKRVKEDYDIDNFLINLENNKVKKEDKVLSFEELSYEILSFIKCVNLGYYASPNKIISKQERSKWRFKVKKYYKALITYDPCSIDGINATNLLKSLYKILSIGTYSLRFSNWNTFGAIGICQSDFLETIMTRKLYNGVTKENMKFCVDLIDVEFDPYEYHLSILMSFVSCLKTNDLKYLAIETINELMKEKKDNYANLKKKSYHQEYEFQEKMNYCTECIIYIYFNLHEVDNGIKYFKKNYIEENKEVKEYILLDRLEMYDLYKDWIKEYESVVNKIDLRDSLKEKYEKIKLEIK